MSQSAWNGGQILELMWSFRPTAVLGAAAELDLFTKIGADALSAEAVAGRLTADLRATTMLLDALASLGFLEKSGSQYRVPEPLRPLLASDSPQSVLPMVWHSMNVARAWWQLAQVVQSGKPGERPVSIRGPEADRAAFVAAMNTVSAPIADPLVAKLGPPKFRHLLDVGGASGTWTIAFLKAVPNARATLFDLPDAVEQARQRFAGTEWADRVALAPGDFYVDELPAGVDYAWVSAIIHQHSREHNRQLFAKIHRALVPGGRIAIRDVVMDETKTAPQYGALFAINMLANTESGGTFTLGEITDDLAAAGFVNPRLVVPAEDMSAVVEAVKPAAPSGN